MKKILHIIPHSHWDREWYLPFEKHRVRLIELFDRLIEVMEQKSEEERKEMIELLKRCDSDEAALDALHTMVVEGGGMERASETMQAYLSRAMHLIAKYEDTPYRKALLDLCAFVAERDK